MNVVPRGKRGAQTGEPKGDAVNSAGLMLGMQHGKNPESKGQ